MLDPSKESLPLRVPVSEHPNRVEGVFVQMASRHGDLMLTTHFKRDKRRTSRSGLAASPARGSRARLPATLGGFSRARVEWCE